MGSSDRVMFQDATAARWRGGFIDGRQNLTSNRLGRRMKSCKVSLQDVRNQEKKTSEEARLSGALI